MISVDRSTFLTDWISRILLFTWLATLSGRACSVEDEGAAANSSETTTSRINHVWANTGEDKVTRDELRASQDSAATLNSLWDGKQIQLFGARSEVVSFNLVLEAVTDTAAGVNVALRSLAGPENFQIASRIAKADADLFNFVGRDIELFFVRYLPIKGISVLAYDHYDERHIPQRLRRPHDSSGYGRGTWQDRPDHDKLYPEIAVPLELHHSFNISAGTNQSIWVDIFIPRDAPAGLYHGAVIVSERGQTTREIPVNLEVLDFALPELPSARTMLFLSKENINRRYLGVLYPGDSKDPDLVRTSQTIVDRHFQLAHRHKISLIDGYLPVEQMAVEWGERLSGELFTPSRGYSGLGEGVGNNVYSIGTYSSWPWKEAGKEAMWTQTDNWVRWFEAQKLSTPTDFFLFLIDESSDFPRIEQWSTWAHQNPGPGKRLPTLATVPAPAALKQSPALDIPTSTFTVGQATPWQKAVEHYQQSPQQRFFMYNGYRPASGSLTTEDDGIALRELAWGQYKMKVERWFIWESTYYNNFQAGLGETNLFRQAHTFGGKGRQDEVLGETGWNYNNGDGVLFYPGTDQHFPDDSYDLPGPIASLRLKHWRRGLQDVDYLTLAAQVDRARVDAIVQRMVPKILWEYGIDDDSDPTWVRTDISWPTSPEKWEAARRELVEIIQQGATKDTP